MWSAESIKCDVCDKFKWADEFLKNGTTYATCNSCRKVIGGGRTKQCVTEGMIKARRSLARRKVALHKQQARRKRELGFNPLNNPFPGSAGHHINKDDVIYIPAIIHQKIPHSVKTGRNMGAINRYAYRYFIYSA